jgi:nitronate monooxygenase
MWPDRRLIDLFGIEHPIVLAPMAGPSRPDLAAAVAEAGGLGSLACAMLTPEQGRIEMLKTRQLTNKPLNANFFCHTPPKPDAGRERAWRERLRAYYVEQGLDPEAEAPSVVRAPFDEDWAAVVEEIRPEVISFHFGLPAAPLLARAKATGAKVISSATTAAEARWLEDHGVDAVIAQGSEAGGHRGMFLTDNLAAQVGTFALVPPVVDAVQVPVIAAGGVTDARGIVAAMALGAAGVQIGTAYLFTPEANVSPLHRAALKAAQSGDTALTNLFTGRPARGIINRLMRELGPVDAAAPAFPLAGGALAPLRAKAEAAGTGDFTPLWSGQAAALGREMSAGELTRKLAEEAQVRLGR